MNDEMKAAVEWLRTLREPGWSCCDYADAILAHLDGEAARLAAAREEQREADLQAIPSGVWGCADYRLGVEDARREITATPLDATPLADRIAELVAVLRSVNETTVKQARAAVEAHERAEKAEAERDAAWLKSDEAMAERDKWRQRAQRAQEERNSLQRRLDEAVRALRLAHSALMVSTTPLAEDRELVVRSSKQARDVLAKYPEET